MPIVDIQPVPILRDEQAEYFEFLEKVRLGEADITLDNVKYSKG